jgi:hypothetical protein
MKPNGLAIIGGLAWGAFFVLTPMELLLLGVLVWIPLLLWTEHRWANRHGFLPGAILRFGATVAVILCAIFAPTKYEDQRIGPLFQPTVSLGELERLGVIYELSSPNLRAQTVSFASLSPTRREVMKEISRKTDVRAFALRCGNGATLLFGNGGGRILVRMKEAALENARTREN